MIFEKRNLVVDSFRAMSPWRDALLESFIKSIESNVNLREGHDHEQIVMLSSSFFRIMIDIIENSESVEEVSNTILLLNSEDFGIFYFRHFNTLFEEFIETFRNFSGASWNKDTSEGWMEFKNFLAGKRDRNVELFV